MIEIQLVRMELIKVSKELVKEVLQSTCEDGKELVKGYIPINLWS